ncbi:ABC transporter permease [Aliiroseovarius sp. PrR006]|uniref:ABC transporter permease n=1 Tax=Aliiroseovarius sp. PrR006 TaxID=2706883 RepID=UPI0013D02D22|nr:ABC transporter permease [Aliiroseovarius sp. PrR006]NDW54607.1 ABC transporter permease [Aliiroseovarius sp. PrR006]
MKKGNSDNIPTHSHRAWELLLDRLRIQKAVISALMIREVVSRYGRGNLGFLWLLLEPLALVTGVILIWGLSQSDGKNGLPIITFVISGYMPLTLWRHVSSYPRLMSNNFGLLYHRQTSVFDIIIARTLTELAGVTAASLIVYFFVLTSGFASPIANPASLVLGWLLMAWFGFSFGCLAAGLSERSEAVSSLIQPFQYLLLPISGCFYLVSWLSVELRHLALLIPLPHMYEMIREGFFGSEITAHYSIPYVIIWCIVVNTLGIWSMLSSRESLSFR